MAMQPGAWTIINHHYYKIYEAQIALISNNSSLAAGEYLSDYKQYLYVGTADYSIAITTIQPANKQPMDIASFLKGNYKKLK